MNQLSVIFQAILLNKQSISKVSKFASYNIWANIFILIVGSAYGIVSYIYMPSELFRFDSNLFKTIAIAIIMLVGILMVFLTRLCLTLLLWAGGKAFGGPGLLSQINPLTSFALAPTIIGFPSIIYLSNGEPLSFMMIILLTLSLLWVYLFSAKVIEVTQNLQTWKAYIAVLVVFIFFTSIYYITLPPAQL